jgi:type 1 fimbria pilin
MGFITEGTCNIANGDVNISVYFGVKAYAIVLGLYALHV